MPDQTTVRVPYPIIIDTMVPVDRAVALEAFRAGGQTLGKAEEAFDSALGEITAFLVRAKNKVAADLEADSVTLSCGLSITAGATFFVEIQATGEIGLSVTWNK